MTSLPDLHTRPTDSDRDTEERVAALVADMTLDEKAALTAGAGPWRTHAVERLGVGAVKMTDGSSGARGEHFHGTTSVCFPSGSALGATWDTGLVREIAGALARDTRDKGAQALLGPTINLHRYPQGGRNFESMGEDPVLVAALAAQFIQGLQESGVAAVPKHLVGNDSEIERESVDVVMAEATLREVYLRPFEAAVSEGQAWAMMSSYNALNGTHTSESPDLLTGIVRDEWGFDGVLLSDWGGTSSTVATALAGLDLEMPGPATHLGAHLADAVRSGLVPEHVVDAAATRLLRLAARTGALDGVSYDESFTDRPADRELTRRAAGDAIVLLSNDGTLPLDRGRLRRVAMIGPNARRTQGQGGGSALVYPPYQTTVLGALQEALGTHVEVEHAAGASIDRYAPILDAGQILTPSGERGALVEYFDTDADGKRSLVRTQVIESVELTWIGAPLDDRGIPMERTVVRCRFRWTPEDSGIHRLGLVAAGRATVVIDGDLVLDSVDAPPNGPHFFGRGSGELLTPFEAEAGRAYDIEIEILPRLEKSATLGAILGAHPPQTQDPIAHAVQAAERSDVAVVVVGTSGEWETEGGDRPDIELPGNQVELVRAVAAANPRTVVVVNAGSAVGLPFADDVAAVAYAWFGGQEVGSAVADVLLGRRDPGGRLPVSIPASQDDVLDIGYVGDGGPGWGGSGGTMTYVEGPDIGYRHHERIQRPARFAFGHGLSYADVEWAEPTATLEGGLPVVRVGLSTASRESFAVPQLYVRRPGSTKALCSFTKVQLIPGAAQEVALSPSIRDLQHWVPGTGWSTVSGTVELVLGRSSVEDVATWLVDIDDTGLISSPRPSGRTSAGSSPSPIKE